MLYFFIFIFASANPCLGTLIENYCICLNLKYKKQQQKPK